MKDLQNSGNRASMRRSSAVTCDIASSTPWPKFTFTFNARSTPPLPRARRAERPANFCSGLENAWRASVWWGGENRRLTLHCTRPHGVAWGRQGTFLAPSQEPAFRHEQSGPEPPGRACPSSATSKTSLKKADPLARLGYLDWKFSICKRHGWRFQIRCAPNAVSHSLHLRTSLQACQSSK